MSNKNTSEWVSFRDIEQNSDPLRLNDIPLVDPPSDRSKELSISPLPPPIPHKPAARIEISSHEEKKLEKKHSEKNLKSIDKSEKATKNGKALDEDPDKKKVFVNGKVITSIYPTNLHLAWLVPPTWDAEKMPKIFSDAQIKLPNEVYTNVMKAITEDLRFKTYCVLFSRILPLWILLSIGVLLLVLFCSPDGGFIVMVYTFIWMIMLFIGMCFCIFIRKYLAIALRHCVKDANRQLLAYNLIAGVQDRGQLSCHKVVVVFIYFETSGCLKDVERLIKIRNSQSSMTPSSSSDSAVAFEAKELIFKYIQQYVKSYVKRRLLFPTRPSEGVSDYTPKHCMKSHCLCQFIDSEHFNRPSRLCWNELYLSTNHYHPPSEKIIDPSVDKASSIEEKEEDQKKSQESLEMLAWEDQIPGKGFRLCPKRDMSRRHDSVSGLRDTDLDYDDLYNSEWSIKSVTTMA